MPSPYLLPLLSEQVDATISLLTESLSTGAGISSWGCRAVNGSTLRLCDGASLWPRFAPCFACTVLPGKSASPNSRRAKLLSLVLR